MKNISRLQSALKRQGILVERRHGAYHLSNQHAQASVLLPEALPLEEKAVDQLLAFASVRSPDAHHGVCKACATPDFHPGSVAPVGTIVATDAEFVIPAAIGTDINCGMRLLTTGLKQAAVEARKPELLRGLTRVLLENGRNVPVPGRAFRALFDDGPQAFIERLSSEGLWARADRDQLQAELAQCVSLADFGGAARYAPEGMVGSRETIRDPGLGTPGGGNHFVELQIVDEILDRHAAYAAGLVKGEVVVMIHTGSRDVGFHVGSRWMDRARAAWPKGLKHPDSKLYGLAGELADEYLTAMGTAARYAWANRMVLGEMVRQEMEAAVGGLRARLVVDVPHNVVLRERAEHPSQGRDAGARGRPGADSRLHGRLQLRGQRPGQCRLALVVQPRRGPQRAAAGRAPHEAGIRVGHLAVRDPARRAQDRGTPQIQADRPRAGSAGAGGTDPIRRAAAAVGDVQGMRQDEGAAAYSGRLRVGISSTSLHTASTSAGCLLKVRYTWPMPLSK